MSVGLGSGRVVGRGGAGFGTFLFLLAACRSDPREAAYAAQLQAERARASARSADELCRTILQCKERQTRPIPADATDNERLEASGEVNMMAPECQACEEEAKRRDLRCRRVER